MLVGNYTPYEGAKCIKSDGNGDVDYIREITPVSDGVFSFAMRVDSAVPGQYILFIAGGSSMMWVSLEDGNIYAKDSWDNNTLLLESYSLSTWYKFTIDFDKTTNSYIIKINDGTWSGPFELRNEDGVPSSDIYLLELVTDAIGAGAVYFDTIAIETSSEQIIGPFPTYFKT
jgi:hypothetical protein